MTSHEIARKLLELPDMPVIISVSLDSDRETDNEVSCVEIRSYKLGDVIGFEPGKPCRFDPRSKVKRIKITKV